MKTARIAPLPPDEKLRVAALREYSILDTLPEKAFDDLTILASYICQTPVALISLIDESRQWFKSKIGIEIDETSRELAFCSYAILQDDITVVPDARLDERFADHPAVMAAMSPVRFYAGAPLITPMGHRIGTICVVDYTPRTLDHHQLVALQALARQVVNQLELGLHLREERKAKEELGAAREEAREGYRIKSEFLANMSHEIRTPLNGIFGMTELLLAEKPDQASVERLNVIQTCGQSLLDLINDTLDFAKLEANKIEVEAKPFNLSLLMQDVVRLYTDVASRKNIRLLATADEAVPQWILGDEFRLRQILSHLVSNAVKFTQVGSVEVALSVRRAPISGGEYLLQVRVQDTGIGISEAAQDHLFQSFSQLDASTTRRYGGAGLGLAISKALCEKMGGTIWVQSQEAKGSSFYFTFVAQETAPVVGLPPAPTELDTQMAQKYPLRILLAEDNRTNQVVALDLLQRLGYQVDLAANGVEALEKLQHVPYDVIFMDCQMPEMDGLEATRRLRQMSHLATQPRVVALTASVMKSDRDRCREAGMDDFLAKPMTLRTLVESLLTAVSSRRADQPLPHGLAERAVANVPMNVALFQQNYRGSEAMISLAVQTFLAEYPRLLHSVRIAVENQNSDALEASAHTLKGAVANFFAVPAISAAHQLEKLAYSRNFISARAMYDILTAELNRLHPVLEALALKKPDMA